MTGAIDIVHITLFTVKHKRLKCMQVISRIRQMSRGSCISENFYLFHIELMHCNLILSFIVVSQKFKLKLISAKLLLRMISCNEPSKYMHYLYSMVD